MKHIKDAETFPGTKSNAGHCPLLVNLLCCPTLEGGHWCNISNSKILTETYSWRDSPRKEHGEYCFSMFSSTLPDFADVSSGIHRKKYEIRITNCDRRTTTAEYLHHSHEGRKWLLTTFPVPVQIWLGKLGGKVTSWFSFF